MTASSEAPLRESQPDLQDSGVHPRFEQRPLGVLVRKLSKDAASLLQSEVELAKTDIQLRVAQTKSELGHTLLAGATIYAGVLALAAGCILLLSLVMAAWIAACAVGCVLVLAGSALLGRAKHLAKQHARPALPLDRVGPTETSTETKVNR